jgi:hypothetical protein
MIGRLIWAILLKALAIVVTATVLAAVLGAVVGASLFGG